MILSLLHNPIQPDTFLFKWKKLLQRGIIAAADDRGTADYFIEQTKELMYSADIAELTIATTSSSALL